MKIKTILFRLSKHLLSWKHELLGYLSDDSAIITRFYLNIY